VLTCVEEIHSVTYKVAIPIYKHGGWWQEKKTKRRDHGKHSEKAALWRIVWWRSGNHLIAGIFYVLHLVNRKRVSVGVASRLGDWNKFITNPGT